MPTIESTRIGVRELRRNLKAHLTAAEPRAVTSHGHNITAFLIQVPNHNTWDRTQRKKALRACLKAAITVIRAQLLST